MSRLSKPRGLMIYRSNLVGTNPGYDPRGGADDLLEFATLRGKPYLLLRAIDEHGTALGVVSHRQEYRARLRQNAIKSKVSERIRLQLQRQALMRYDETVRLRRQGNIGSGTVQGTIAKACEQDLPEKVWLCRCRCIT